MSSGAINDSSNSPIPSEVDHPGLQQDASQAPIQDGAVTSSRSSIDDSPSRSTSQALVVLIEITWMQQQRDRHEALRSAGLAIRDLDRKIVSDLTVADHLRMLEDRIVTCIHEELSFDNFEIRLLDHTTRKLELSSRKPHAAQDRRSGPLLKRTTESRAGWRRPAMPTYAPMSPRTPGTGRDSTAASSLTVPQMQDEVIGVLNVESLSANAFDQDDLELAEMLAHYIADAMHMLDLLVVERFTTREQATKASSVNWMLHSRSSMRSRECFVESSPTNGTSSRSSIVWRKPPPA